MMNHISESFSNQILDIASTYATDDIFILGKGPSADQVKAKVYTNSLVIALNDAERIAPADITIFAQDWVKQSLELNGYRSRAYVTCLSDFSPVGRKVIHAPCVTMTEESSELIMQRFMGDEIVIEDMLFLTALKIAKRVAELKKRKQRVYLVGFDFDSSLGYSRLIGHDYAPHNLDEKSVKISLQEFYFFNAMYFLRDSELSILHVGGRHFSSMSADELNKSLCGKSEGSGSYSVEVVAELTTNHFGDRSRLERMIRSSKAAGADYIKLQKRDVETFYNAEQLSSPYVSPFGRTFGDYRRQLELTRDDFEFVSKLCDELEIGWFASVLDEASFKFMMDVGLGMVKLPSTISERKDYLKYVAGNYRGAIVLSTGMTDSSYERFIVDNFSACEKLYLLQCNSAYPTPLEDCNVAVVSRYKELTRQIPNLIPGYSSHDFGWEASALAVAAGARMVEKHVKLGNTEWAHFDAVAVDLSTPSFKEYVDRIRMTELILGSEQKKINDSEHHKYDAR